MLLTFVNSSVTTAICSSTLSEMGNCSIQFGQHPFYQDLGPPINGSLNSSLALPLMGNCVLYYLRITFTLDSEPQPIILRQNYTTGGSGIEMGVGVGGGGGDQGAGAPHA